jgi:hypothetical protein
LGFGASEGFPLACPKEWEEKSQDERHTLYLSFKGPTVFLIRISVELWGFHGDINADTSENAGDPLLGSNHLSHHR